jgi:hypothetical protein
MLSPTGKRSRGKNFSSIEDVQLAKSWPVVSQDASVGSDQKMETFWNRIGEDFNSQFEGDSRTDSSLQTRWSALQATINKFNGIFATVKGEDHSGWSPEDELKEALNRYAEFSKGRTAFTSLAVWEVVRNSPKWKISLNTIAPPQLNVSPASQL